MNADNPSAFPVNAANLGGPGAYAPDPGMSLRDWFAGQALSSTLDKYPEWQIADWFGKSAAGITREQIRAKAAYQIADAMLAERAKNGGAR